MLQSDALAATATEADDQFTKKRAFMGYPWHTLAAGAPLAERSDLADVITRDVDEFIDNLDSLEVVMLLFREQARAWTTDQVAARLRISYRVARRELDRMRGRGIARTEGDDPSFQFDVSDADRTAAVARIATAYGTRRIELINYVASQTLKRIQSIADAFKIAKDHGGD